MKSPTTLVVMAALLSSAWLAAQTIPADAKPAKSADAAPRGAYYVDLTMLQAGLILPEPPAVGSATNSAELAELHRIEQARTPAQVAAAQADDGEQDIFSFRTVLGETFTAAALPATASLSAHVHNEEAVVAASIKGAFHRPRPYQTDPTLHPVCPVTDQPNSYPSGHTLSGYLLAFTLIEMVPEKRVEILARADDYAHNRLVCGVHHPSDLEASRRVAAAVFGYMLATPRFERDLAVAREELRQKLGMPATQN